MGLTSDHGIGRGLRKDVKELKGKFHQGSDQPVHSVGASLEWSVPTEPILFVAVTAVIC